MKTRRNATPIVRVHRRAGSLAIALYAVLSVLFAVWTVVGVLSVHGAAEHTDYMSYHAAARMILEGDGDCLYDRVCQIEAQRRLMPPDIELTRGLPYNNPPSLAAFLTPLARFPLGVGLGVWIGISVVAFVAAASRLATDQRKYRLVVTALACSSYPVFIAAVRGQVSLLVAASIAGASWLFVVRRKEVGGGILVGLATLKPTLLPFVAVWLVATGRFRAVATAVAVAAGLVVFAAAVVTPDQILAYPAYALGQFSDPNAAGIHPREMVNWRAAGLWSGGGTLGAVLVWSGSLLTVAAVAFVWWRTHESLALAAALFATPLLAPHANQHESILAVVAWLLVLRAPALPTWPQRLALIMQAVSWFALILWGEAGSQLLFALILASLGVVVWLAAAPVEAQGPHSQPGGVRKASGHRGRDGSEPAFGG